MAQRFGGRYSPQMPGPDGPGSGAPGPAAAAGWTESRRSHGAGRANLLFLVPLPLALRAFLGGPDSLVMRLLALGLMLLGAWLTREGLAAQEAYEARRIAHRPAIPRKILGGAAIGLGIALAASAGGQPAAPALVLGVLGLALHLFAFGADPLRSKGMEGIDSFQQDRVARAIAEAETHLAAMSDAIRRARDPALERRIDSFAETARRLFRTVEADPRDLTAARKYLVVYLLGSRDATAKFVEIYARSRDAEARAKFLALLDDLERNFAARTDAFLVNDKSDLNIEIDVLRERLEREGVRAADVNAGE